MRNPIRFALVALVAFSLPGLGAGAYQGATDAPAAQATGFWSRHVLDPANGADGVHAADVSGNGLLDLVVSFERNGGTVLYLNPGSADEDWQRVVIADGPFSRGSEDVFFFDRDGDGVAEAVLTAVKAPGMRLYWHQPQAADRLAQPDDWQTQRIGPAYRRSYIKVRAVPAADDTALVAAGSKTTFGLWKGAVELFHYDPQSGEILARRVLHETGKVIWIEFMDVDGDGLPDLIMSSRDELGWFRNPGGVPLAENWQYERIDEGVVGFNFCDLDGDGRDELVAVMGPLEPDRIIRTYKRQRETGNWVSRDIAATSGQPGIEYRFSQKSVACGDLDQDGQDEVVVLARGGILLMDPATDPLSPWKVTLVTEFSADSKYDDIQLVDMDNQGDLDIVTTEEGRGIRPRGSGVLWFENRLDE